MENQPTPVFTLNDLDKKLSKAYDLLKNATHSMLYESSKELKEIQGQKILNAKSILHELIATVTHHKLNMLPIDMPTNVNQEMLDVIEVEKIQFNVVGVQLYESKKIQGVALYTTIVKARKVKDILNQRFAELKVDHEAKISNYPVY